MCRTHIRSSLILFALLHVSEAAAQQNYHKVASLDYCADQFVLKLVEPARIAAVSKDADREFSYIPDSAAGHKKQAKCRSGPGHRSGFDFQKLWGWPQRSTILRKHQADCDPHWLRNHHLGTQGRSRQYKKPPHKIHYHTPGEQSGILTPSQHTRYSQGGVQVPTGGNHNTMTMMGHRHVCSPRARL